MNSPVTESALNGAAEQIRELTKQLEARLHAQQDTIDRQRGEIERLTRKIEQLRETLDQFYKHCGMEARQPTPEEEREHRETELSAEELWAELDRRVPR